MKVRAIMTSPVISVAPDSTVLEAVRIMLQRHISGLPVIEKSGELVGIVTEGDFLRRAETGTQRRRPRWLEYLVGPGRLADEYTRSHGRKVYEIMTFGALTVTEDTPLDEVVRLMEKRRIKRLPVVRGTAVVGIVSRANLVHALAGLAREVKPAAASDQAIHDRIVAELAGQSWAPTALINVIVRDGVVELWGAITDERERAAIIVAAENAPGVKGVNDHLAWVEPMSGMAFSPSDDGTVQAKAS
jgi:CBS domain-containing protein